MDGVKTVSVLFVFILILSISSNFGTLQKSKNFFFVISPMKASMNMIGSAFAESDDENKSASSGGEEKSGGNGNSNPSSQHQSEDNGTQTNQENNQASQEHPEETLNETGVMNHAENETEAAHPEENNQMKSEHQGENQNETQANMEGENETLGTPVEENQTSSEDIENEMNNEKAMHHQTEQDATDIEEAKTNQTIAAEVDIDQGNVNQKSIDNSVTVKTENSTSDTVNLTVSATNQTGPKVILINLNSTTIDVANVKYLHVMYDGNPIAPAANIDEILHTTSSDQPHYAILITQSGAQILISIPHFSTHTITLSSISKVISPVPEFPLSVIAVFASIIAITIAITRKRIALRY